MLRINLVYYGLHEPSTDSRLLNVQPEYMIVNTRHGLWGEIYSNNVMQNTAVYKAAGIKIIGYLTAGYEGTGSAGHIDSKWYSLDMNKKLIKNMAEIDGVRGVFIDECTSFPKQNAKEYLKTLTELAHGYRLMTWGNVGEAKFDPWYFTDGGFDLLQSNENWHGQKLSQVQRNWGSRISVTGNDPNLTAQDAFNLTINAWEKGLAYCYMSNVGYISLPRWLEQYANLILSHELHP